MSVFTDYAAKMRQLKTPFNTPAQMQPIRTPSFAPVAVEQPQQNGYTYTGPQRNPNDIMVAQGIRENTYYSQQPQVDPNNAIGSLAEMLGPTPAEREARERRMLENRAKMSAWTGLFDGLRQLGNLYYATKGATPQQLASPYHAIDNEINQQRTIADANDNYRRQYAQSLYNLRRQGVMDQMQRETHQAQLDWYKNRDEQNAEKVAIQRMKAENDAAYKNATLEQKERMNDIMAEYYAGRISLTEAQTRLANVRAAYVGAPVTTTTDDGKGGVKTTVKTVGSGGRSGAKRKKGKTISGYQRSGSQGNQASTQGKGKLYQ